MKARRNLPNCDGRLTRPVLKCDCKATGHTAPSQPNSYQANYMRLMPSARRQHHALSAHSSSWIASCFKLLIACLSFCYIWQTPFRIVAVNGTVTSKSWCFQQKEARVDPRQVFGLDSNAFTADGKTIYCKLQLPQGVSARSN